MAFSAKGVYERYLDLITPVFIYICLCAFPTIVGLIVTMKYVFEIRHGPLQDSKNASLDSISIYLKRSFILKIASILISTHHGQYPQFQVTLDTITDFYR